MGGGGGVEGAWGARVSDFLQRISIKKNICFFFFGKGGGTRVSGFLTFNTESKSKKKTNIFL